MFSIKANAIDDVNSQALSQLTVYPLNQFPAQVIALNNTAISSQIAGIIESKPLLVGTAVQKQQILVKLDCTDTYLAKEQAVSALKRLQVEKQLAQQQFLRAKKLVRVKSISKQELDQRQTSLDASIASFEQQQVALKIIDRNITKCSIKAPINGIIVNSNVQLGSYINPGVTLLNLLDPNSVEIEVSLPLAIANDISQASNISFVQGSQAYPVNIRVKIPMVDSQTKQQAIRLTLLNPSKPLSGSSGIIQWHDTQAHLSSRYVVQREQQLGVFIALSGKAIFKPLTQAIEGQNSPIDLSPNTLIITNKLLILNNNDSIN